ncbi:MAG: hypothetical protein JWO57_2998, partial [Pseudonocardiales bacterium]|nr:hypothetical protein [Pseudonocardiales bacterium]
MRRDVVNLRLAIAEVTGIDALTNARHRLAESLPGRERTGPMLRPLPRRSKARSPLRHRSAGKRQRPSSILCLLIAFIAGMFAVLVPSLAAANTMDARLLARTQRDCVAAALSVIGMPGLTAGTHARDCSTAAAAAE